MSPGLPSADTTPWHQRREAGHRAGLWLVQAVARLCGRRAAHLLVAPIAAYFWVARGAERRASRQFLAHVFGRPATLVDGLRHFWCFARVAVDRLFLFAPGGQRIPMRVSGREPIEAALRAGRGCILVSAHFGSFEAARQAGLVHATLRLRLLLDRAVNRRLVEELERIDPQFAAGILDAAGEPRALVLKIGEALAAGEWIGWLADRWRGEERTVSVDFLGRPARLPASPFIIAQLFRVPVFMVLAVFDGKGYDVVVEQLADDSRTERGDRDRIVQERVAHFAARLGHHVRRAPFNWFNLYDFWS